MVFRDNDALFGKYISFKEAIANGVANAFWSRHPEPAAGRFSAVQCCLRTISKDSVSRTLL